MPAWSCSSTRGTTAMSTRRPPSAAPCGVSWTSTTLRRRPPRASGPRTLELRPRRGEAEAVELAAVELDMCSTERVQVEALSNPASSTVAQPPAQVVIGEQALDRGTQRCGVTRRDEQAGLL